MQPQIIEASALLVFSSWEKITSEDINVYIDQIAKERNVSVNYLKQEKNTLKLNLKSAIAII